MRNPKKGRAKKKAPKLQVFGDNAMQADAPSTSAAPTVWRPGVDAVDPDEELEYDRTAYDCLHGFRLGWPCLSFDIIRDELGAPRSTFPHTMFLAAGTQADTARSNYFAVVKLANLGQGKHGKKAAEKKDEDDSDTESSDMDEEDEEEEGAGTDKQQQHDSTPAHMHYRVFQHHGGVNRLRVLPQSPGIMAVWGDTGQVKIFDVTSHLQAMAVEAEPKNNPRPLQVSPLMAHTHSSEGYAMDWSRAKPGRMATGDCRGKVHTWEPVEGGKWQISAAYKDHTASVEDLQWSPTEETVFASCSVDRSLRIWDTRDRTKAQLTVPDAHATDVNVISWNSLVTYMLASGDDDGSLRIWDLRHFGASDGYVSSFNFHRGSVTSVEWSPYESSMLATAGDDNQLAVWDLALERDPEEEAALAPEDNAAAPEDLPAQLLFIHAGQSHLKELHWHGQIPGMIVSTAADGFNAFKPSNI